MQTSLPPAVLRPIDSDDASDISVLALDSAVVTGNEDTRDGLIAVRYP